MLPELYAGPGFDVEQVSSLWREGEEATAFGFRFVVAVNSLGGPAAEFFSPCSPLLSFSHLGSPPPTPHPPPQVVATAYDVPVPGYGTRTVGNLRLWHALPDEEFDLAAFNEGAYDQVARRGGARRGGARFGVVWARLLGRGGEESGPAALSDQARGLRVLF